jgi:phenylalanyl-tRNA synthetase beta chain
VRRLISLFVDLTNYVMLELGQPLHAFDYDTLRGGRIVVRKAREGEKLTTLNEVEHELRTDQMMICDAERPVAAAGVMGGLETEVTGSTQTVLLESAHFVNTSVRRTRKQLGLSTEASYRFERSVDPEGVVAALNRFAELLSSVSGEDSTLPGVIDVYPHPPSERWITLRMSRVRTLLGLEVSGGEARNYLERLGFTLGEGEESFEVAAPSWRPDIQREDDLVEEIGRVHGYDKIPEELPHGATPQGGVFGLPAFTDRAREAIVRSGFIQTWSHSLRDEHPLDASGERVGPRNPNSPDMALLRNSLLPSVADAVRRNGAKDLHLFEIGRVFAAHPESERMQMALLSMGSLQSEHWVKGGGSSADFFSLKGVLEAALASLGASVEFVPGDDSRFHPTKQAVLQSQSGERIGVIGELHPDVAEQLGFSQRTTGAEVELEPLFRSAEGKHRYREVSRNPAVRRDMAVLVDKAVPYEKIAQTLRSACGDVLEKQWLFDVYDGQGIPEGKHSLAIALQLRKQGENFTDEEANQVRERAAAALAELGATLR